MYLTAPSDRTLNRPLPPTHLRTRPYHIQNRHLLKRMRTLCAGIRLLVLLERNRTARANLRLVHDDVVVVKVAALRVGNARRRRARLSEPRVLVTERGPVVAELGVVYEPLEVAVLVVAGVACGEGQAGVLVFLALLAGGEELADTRESEARSVEGRWARRWAVVHVDIAAVLVLLLPALGLGLRLALGGALGHLRVVLVLELSGRVLPQPVECLGNAHFGEPGVDDGAHALFQLDVVLYNLVLQFAHGLFFVFAVVEVLARIPLLLPPRHVLRVLAQHVVDAACCARDCLERLLVVFSNVD